MKYYVVFLIIGLLGFGGCALFQIGLETLAPKLSQREWLAADVPLKIGVFTFGVSLWLAAISLLVAVITGNVVRW
ncbi:hypothetical protein [Schleiferilactobacillus harbinensis]|uniref:Uncharacterized protein n=1 Tax=Schleiferilactobacillus harbinensis TaxID=304207 RepID=A0A5P8M6G3_9LACO|nr:hypothetical protein [Schleiferilactobacillus harbinensis]QFR24098.1 hypothetical protein D1010_12280 [Schleiferilactobacillus harbinensis]